MRSKEKMREKKGQVRPFGGHDLQKKPSKGKFRVGEDIF